MLSIEKLNHYYGESHTLWDVTLAVEKGKCTCLMGRNGVGKTTLLNCIMGLLPLDSGQIRFEDVLLQKQPAERRAQLGIGYVPQGRQIFPQLTVNENLCIGLTTGKQKLPHIPELVFELFPVLGDMLERLGGDLSGGQQQQLAIGRALVLQPNLLILDEPTEGIQPNIVQEIAGIIRHLCRDAGITVLLVEQKLGFARAVADHFAIMDRGRIVVADTVDKLDDRLIQKYLTV